MANSKKEQGKISKAIDILEAFVNAVCVVFLTLQVMSIIVMVVGRYFFNHVPRGIEEFALFCMVWLSLLSISLSIRDDSHIKMEIIDVIVAPKKIKYFQNFASLVNIAFSTCMVLYGIKLVKLTSTNTMSTFRISEGFLYLAIPVSGALMVLTSAIMIYENLRRTKNVN